MRFTKDDKTDATLSAANMKATIADFSSNARLVEACIFVLKILISKF